MSFNAHVLLAGAVKIGESGWDPPEWGREDADAETEARNRRSVLATTTRAGGSVTKPGQFIMDSAAGVSVANESSWLSEKAIVRQIPPGACSLSGVGGDKTDVTAMSGLFKPLEFLRVNHAKGSIANIISVPDLQERLFVHYRDQKTPKDRMEISEDPDGEIVIAIAPKDPATRYYMLQAPESETAHVKAPTTRPECTSVLNVYSDAYSMGWSKNSISRALKVKRLHRAFSYISVSRLKGLVRSNRFGDIGPQEISLYEKLHDAGDCSCCPLGKMTRSPQVTPE